MAKEQKKELSLYERSEYIVVKEEYRENGKYVELYVPHASGRARLFIPYHTEEEKRQIGANFAHAAFKMCFPNDDPANYSAVTVVQ